MSDLQPIGGGLQPIGGGSTNPPPTPPPPPPTLAPARMVAPPPPVSGYTAPRATPGANSAPYSRPATESQRSRDDDDPDKPPVYLLVIGGVAGVAALAWGVSFFLPSAPVDAPAAYVPFAAADKSFTCDVPDKWHVEALGSASAEAKTSVGNGLEARQSDARIEITCSSIAGLITGQLLYGNDPIPAGTFGSRAKPIFNHHGKGFKKRFKNYKETKLIFSETQLPKMTGIVQVENTREFVPDIRCAEFTADGNPYGFGGKRHGYRMAVGGSTQIVNVVCECSERDWQKLKPAFERVMVSLAEPRPAGMQPGGVPLPGAGGAPLPAGGAVPGFGDSGFH